ncbi:voltage-gated chloride channel protein [Clostridia bacterium]|nr:voltage-gated chloride channel protein [Clostridia bacterium]
MRGRSVFIIIFGGAFVGVLLFTFLRALEFVNGFTAVWYVPMIFFLPLVGAVREFVYGRYGRSCERGFALLDDGVRGTGDVPARMSVLTYVFTLLSHLFGASVGKEGAGVQISGALFYNAGKLLKLNKTELRYIIMAGMSAGFAGIFGTPVAGAIFGVEICKLTGSYPEQSYASAGGITAAAKLRRLLPWQELLPNLAAAYSADLTIRLMGYRRASEVLPLPPLSPSLLIGLAVTALIAGLIPRLYKLVRDFINKTGRAYIKLPVLRGFMLTAGVTVIAVVFGLKNYFGTSEWLIEDGLLGKTTVWDAFIKAGFTAVSTGAGLIGGEVTPMFCAGTALGGAVAVMFSVSANAALFGGVGMLTAFGGLMGTPLAGIALGCERFGSGCMIYYAAAVCIGVLLPDMAVNAIKRRRAGGAGAV